MLPTKSDENSKQIHYFRRPRHIYNNPMLANKQILAQNHNIHISHPIQTDFVRSLYLDIQNFMCECLVFIFCSPQTTSLAEVFFISLIHRNFGMVLANLAHFIQLPSNFNYISVSMCANIDARHTHTRAKIISNKYNNTLIITEVLTHI